MTSARQLQPGNRNAKQLVAVTTVALPVVMLSSLALAQPAAAAGPQQLPAKNTASVLANTARAVAARVASMPASMVATAVPTSLASTSLAPAALPAQAAVPNECTVVSGDTVSAIAARYGLDVWAVLKANNLGPSTLIYPGQKIQLTGGAAAAPSAPSAPSSPAPAPADGGATYTVKSGDTISAIAARHGLGVNAVLQLNGLTATTIIYPGQTIQLGGQSAPAPQPAAPAQAPVNVVPAASAPAAPAAPAASGSYTIRSGDTLSSIAAKNNVSLADLMQANNLKATSIIYAGKTLNLPGTVAPASSSTPTALVPSTFLHYTYPEAVVAQANVNKAALMAAPVPSAEQMKQIISSTASQMGVDPSLALAFAWQESGFNQQAVSPANAIGAMQVIPQSGEWASELVGRHLNLLDPYDNVTAGVAIIRALVSTSDSTDNAIAGYYQGQTSVSMYGMYPDTEDYVAAVKANQALFR
jgi:LysM repeat protein